MADLEVVNADPSEPPSHAAVIKLANELLSEFSIPTRIRDISDISASLFVVLYESLFSDRLPGIIRQPSCKDDEIHNCQIVIDVLSTDVIRDSLSHIRGEDIVAGDITAISNLLDIFLYLLQYVVNRIESDVDHDDTRSIGTIEADSEIATPKSSQKHSAKKVADAHSEMKNSGAYANKTNNNGGKHKSRTANLNKNENRKAYDDHKVISHEDFYSMSFGGSARSKLQRPPSPIKHDQSQSLLGQKTVDSDFDLDGDKHGYDFKGGEYPKIAWEDKPAGRTTTAVSDIGALRQDGASLRDKESADAGAASVGAATATLTAGDGKLGPTSSGSNAFSASMPAPSRTSEFESKDPLRSTVGPIPYHSRLTPEKTSAERSTPVKGLSSSYNDLRHLVEKTAALTRVALATSPVRSRTDRDLDITDILERDRPRPTLSTEGVRLAKELNAIGMSPRSKGYESPGKPGKKVAFASSRLEERYSDRPSDDYSRTPLSTLSDNEYYSDRLARYGAGGDLDYLYEDIEVRRSGEPAKKPSKPKSKRQTLAKHLATNRQPELGAAHMTLRTDDRALQRKQELLRKFYEKDHLEFAEDVDDMLEKDARKSRETEAELIKKCAEGAMKKKPKGVKKQKGTLMHPSCKKPRISKVVSTKAKRHSPDLKKPPLTPDIKLDSEEDLLPLLLEEFPHLHLSEHTWHELWRRGLHQIEALTRSYQESQRKKSKAQCQLEEAAERHDLLAEIMRKQLDHEQRMREIKEQKQHQVQMRNKNHEKRIQSARARRYYNEYQVRARAKQLKRRTKEEMVFRELFKDALSIQKERIKDIRQYATDQRKKQENRRQNEIDSLENFYQDQFEMLAERLTKERKEAGIRDSAQQKMTERMKRELRKKMESEIKQYQDQIFRDDDDAHFRQLDAEKVKQVLHMARYSAKI